MFVTIPWSLRRLEQKPYRLVFAAPTLDSTVSRCQGTLWTEIFGKLKLLVAHNLSLSHYFTFTLTIFLICSISIQSKA